MRSDAKTQENDFYTYTLAYPDGRIFYVGKGSGSRINEHEREARRGATAPRHEIIRKIWESGGQVQKTKIRENITEEEAFALEKALIRQYGPKNLANWTVWEKDSLPDPRAAIQASLYFTGTLRDQIKACMELDGIEYSRIAFCQYVQDICYASLQQYIEQKLAS